MTTTALPLDLHRRPSTPLRAGLVLGSALLCSLVLTGCSGSGAAEGSFGGASGGTAAAAADPGSSRSDDFQETQLESGVPTECLDAFPMAFGPADLSAATLMPADFPIDAVDATLCQTAATGSGVQTIDWATDTSGPEVLDAVEAALPATYSVTRSDEGLGEQLDGTAGDVVFTVLVREGAWTLQLGPAS